MPIPNYTKTADRTRLAFLMRRRHSVPSDMAGFPEPFTSLAPEERSAWEMFRAAFNGTGAIDAGQFAIMEGVVFAFVQGNRFRALRDKTPADDPKHAAYERLVRQFDASLRTWLQSLGPTRAMLVHLAVYAPELVDRIGLRPSDRRRIRDAC